MTFTQNINNWYSENKRFLPWRESKNPYRVWLSEIILQQTKIVQGLPYFNRFISAYPTVKDLANANQQDVLKLWEGLGYYSRARNLHETAKFIADDLDSIFPDNYADLLKLKGVGEYTAAAISSICFNENQAVLDGNVFRVLSRYFGVSTPIDTGLGKKDFRKIAQANLDLNNPGDHNQALMDFGSEVCKPKQPLCSTCVLQLGCQAFQTNSQSVLPVKRGKTKVREVYFYYILLEHDDGVSIRKRGSGIWQGLYEFPYVESSKELPVSEIQARLEQDLSISPKGSLVEISSSSKPHKLSHLKIHSKFYSLSQESDHYIYSKWKSLNNYPFPVLISNFVKEFKDK
jgi:A/G-specific adenine glycosylase